MSEIIKIPFETEYFDPLSTLDCGQIFRFSAYNNGFKVFSMDKCAVIYLENDKTVIECYQEDKDYFYNFFDLDRDYKTICESANKENISILSNAIDSGKGIRILNQDKIEMLFSFIVSQNNNIPRIKGIIEKLCFNLGERKTFKDIEYHAFPSIEKMASVGEEFYTSIGLGYRAKYIKNLAEEIKNGLDVVAFDKLDTISLKKQLSTILGVGPKVADCVALFGFHRSDSFPVDTWIEKVYREDFKGKLKDRNKISEYFVKKFKENAGYYQQYLFYYKRMIEKQVLTKK